MTDYNKAVSLISGGGSGGGSALLGIITFKSGATNPNGGSVANASLNIDTVLDFDGNDISTDVYANWDNLIFVPYVIGNNSKQVGVVAYDLASTSVKIVNPTANQISLSAGDITISALIVDKTAGGGDGGDGR